MPFTLRPYRCFPVHCSVSHNTGPFQGQGTIWNLSCTGWRLSGDLPMRQGEGFSLTTTLPNKQRILIPLTVVQWSTRQELAVEDVVVVPHTHARLRHYMKRLVQESVLWEKSRAASEHGGVVNWIMADDDTYSAHCGSGNDVWNTSLVC